METFLLTWQLSQQPTGQTRGLPGGSRFSTQPRPYRSLRQAGLGGGHSDDDQLGCPLSWTKRNKLTLLWVHRTPDLRARLVVCGGQMRNAQGISGERPARLAPVSRCKGDATRIHWDLGALEGPRSGYPAISSATSYPREVWVEPCQSFTQSSLWKASGAKRRCGPPPLRSSSRLCTV